MATEALQIIDSNKVSRRRETPARCRQLKHMIGNTPLLALRFRYRGTERVIYAKAEHLNLTGSIKDRMAFHILKRAYQEGHIQPGDTIAEATSGNTRSRRLAARWAIES